MPTTRNSSPRPIQSRTRSSTIVATGPPPPGNNQPGPPSIDVSASSFRITTNTTTSAAAEALANLSGGSPRRPKLKTAVTGHNRVSSWPSPPQSVMTTMPSAPAVPTRGSIDAGVSGGGFLDLSGLKRETVPLLLYTYKPNHAHNPAQPSPLPSASTSSTAASSQVIINYAALPWGAKPGDYLEIRQTHMRRQSQDVDRVQYLDGATKKKSHRSPALKDIKPGKGRDGYVFKLGEDVPSANVHQIQVPDSVATAFGFQHRLEVEVRKIQEPESAHTDYVEFYFSQYLGRADMWRLGMSLEGMTLHVGEKVSLAGGAVRAEVNYIVRSEKGKNGKEDKNRKYASGIATPKTKTIFRSKSAQVYLFIQLCQETWEFDEDGERYIEKVVHGYLPELFARWADKGTSHVVTIIFFARIYYDDDEVAYLRQHDLTEVLMQDYAGRWCKDFFKVAIDLERRNDWTQALPEIKKQLEKSEQEILLDYHLGHLSRRGEDGEEVKIVGRWSFAYEGNALEAINLALNPFDEHYVDRDLSRTGLSISVVTPGTGHFAVDKNLLRLTTERMVDHGMAVDFVCLTKMPLHSVPLFSYVSHRPTGPVSELNPSGSKAKPITPDLLYFDAHMSHIKDTELADCYSLPSWISCSFYAVTHDKPFREDRFVARCKMYEIQMLGILDHNLTTVIVPLLDVEDTPMPRRPLTVEDRKDIRDSFDQDTFGAVTDPVNKSGSPQPDSAPASIPASYQSARLLAEKVKEERSNSISKIRSIGSGTRLSPIKATAEPEHSDQLGIKTSVRGASPAPSSLSLNRGGRAMSPTMRPQTVNAIASARDASPFVPGSRHTSSPKAVTRSASPCAGDLSPTLGKHPGSPPNIARAASPSHASIVSLDGGSGASTPRLTPVKKLKNQTSKSSFASRFGASWLFGSLATRSQPSFATPAIETVARTDVVTIVGNRSNSPSPSLGTLPMKLPNLEAIVTPSTPSPSKDKGQSQVTQPLPIATAQMSRHKPVQHAEEDPISRSFRNNSKTQGLSRSHDDSSWRNRNNAFMQSSRHFTVNPCKPSAETIDRIRDAGGRRWRFVLPGQTQQHIVQWPSLLAPACLPLTTDFLPTQKQSDELYTTGTYTVQCYLEDGAFLIRGDAAETNLSLAMMREMVSQRLSQNFQVIVLPHELTEPGQARPMPIHLEKDADIGVELVSGGASEVLKNGQGAIWLSWANHIHRLLFHPTKQEIIVHWMTRKISHSTESVRYRCLVWPAGMRGYQPGKATFNYPDVTMKVNYNHLDHLINGDRKTLDPLRYWRTRFVLIPSGKEPVSFPGMMPKNEHLESVDLLWLGAQKVIETLNRFLLKKSDSQLQPVSGSSSQQAPLRIVTTTFDPSTCVLDEELMMDLERQINGKEKTEGVGKTLEGMTLAALAEMMCQTGNGLVIRTRWWEARQHVSSFTGAQFCEWLQNTFEDVTTREKADQWAKSLLEKGLIEHVTGSHGFLDYWHLYYRLREPYDQAQPNKRNNKSWFGSGSKLATNGVATLATENGHPPSSNGPAQSDSTGTGQIPAASSTSSNVSSSNAFSSVSPLNSQGGPTVSANDAKALLAKIYEDPKEGKGKKKRRIKMSQTRVLDLDQSRKSDRAEVAILHADVVHNARNAFHFELNWLGVTAALLDELRQKLSAQAERYGLRFVETPVEQLADMPLKCAYRCAIPIRLALPPPVIPDLHLRLVAVAHGTGQAENYFEYCILTKKFGFVLDVEAADRYPDNIEVVYSYRKSKFDYSQFCHKTGLVLVQCVGGEKGFLWSDNRLIVSAPTRRGVGNRVEEARALRKEMEDFCGDREALRKFYEEVLPPLPGEVAELIAEAAEPNETADAEVQEELGIGTAEKHVEEDAVVEADSEKVAKTSTGTVLEGMNDL
ncbi:hypothetical protein IAR55_002381 [Kwoniella newhampshirensis]|uniref:Vacuolar membrane-associated protein IML1 n=1 Tax=Kwoniella newhampshirensis TaxID=1651941 RepID=A0AAW0Z117_9TREE